MVPAEQSLLLNVALVNLFARKTLANQVLLVNRMIIMVLQLDQRCPILLLKDQCPAEFTSNLLQHTCLEVSTLPSSGVFEINSAR